MIADIKKCFPGNLILANAYPAGMAQTIHNVVAPKAIMAEFLKKVAKGIFVQMSI
jgi:hypothetical protein